MLIINSTMSVGDGIRSFTGTYALAKHMQSQGQQVFLYFTNRLIDEIFPYQVAGINSLQDYNQISSFNTNEEIYNISWNKQTLGRSPLKQGVDFNEAIGLYFGIDVPRLKDYGQDFSHIPLSIPLDETVPTYDIVLSPFCLNNYYTKSMPPEFWQGLINQINNRGKSVVVIGSTKLPNDDKLQEIEPDISRFKNLDFYKYNFTKYLTGCDYFLDQSLVRVGNLLNKMRYSMISLDSGPSWLINLLQRPHLELHPHQCVEISKFSPGLNERTELGHPITVQDILDRIDRMF